MNTVKKLLLSAILMCVFTKINTGDEPKTIVSHEERIKNLEESVLELKNINELMFAVIIQQNNDIKGLAHVAITFYEKFEILSSHNPLIADKNKND